MKDFSGDSWVGRTDALRARSRFLASLGMTDRKARAKAKEEADPCGMTARKARARARGTATARARAKAKEAADSQRE